MKTKSIIYKLYATDIKNFHYRLKGHPCYSCLVAITKSEKKRPLNWRQKLENNLHYRIRHAPQKVSKRWKVANKRSMESRVKNWTFYNRISETEKSKGFLIINR